MDYRRHGLDRASLPPGVAARWVGRARALAARWRGTARRTLGGLVPLLGLLLLPLSMSGAGSPTFSEFEVKAAWLFNFARFVDWPTNTFTNPATPLVVGVVGVGGKDPFGRELEKAFTDRTIRGRPVILKRGPLESELTGCHLLYVAPSERRRFRELFEKLRGAPVLTVGESDEFLEQGGIINFVRKDNAVRFDIDVRSAQRAGLKLDANLLKVALTVRGRYE